MRDRNEGPAGSAGQPRAIRYVPATLAAILAVGALVSLPGLSSWTRPWFYGLFLKAAGPPAPSRLTVLVTAEGAGLESADRQAENLATLATALLNLGPKAVALEMPSGIPDAFLGGSEAQGPLILAGDFVSLRSGASEAGEDEGGKAATDLPPILARSLYPQVEGAGALRLPRGESLELPGGEVLRTATGAFAGPLPGGHPAFAFPAFARLERGAVAGLGVETARRMLGVPAASVTYVEGVGVLFDPAHILPVDGEGNLYLRFHEGAGIPTIPASRILDGTVRPEEIQGKAVVVAAAGRPPVRTAAGYLSPAEIWATTLSNLLEKGTVSPPSWGRMLALAIGLAFAAILLAVHFADIGLLGTLVMAILLAALYPVLSMLLFVKSAWWLPPELPPFLVLAAWLPFGLTRLFSPKPVRVQAPPIKPAPVYDPLVAMGGGPARSQGAPPSIPGAAAQSQMPPAPPRPTGANPLVPPTPAHGISGVTPGQSAPAAAANARPTPPRGIPQTPAQGPAFPAPATPAAPAIPAAGQPIPPGSFAPAADANRSRPQSGRERQGPIPPAPAAPPAQPAHPQPALPVDGHAVPAAAAADGFRDPRDPVVLGGPAPAGPVIAPRPTAPPPQPQPQPVMPHPHNGSISADIERDSKGGLIRVGKYRIVRKMGFGSGGDVFEGFDTHMGRKVAIKTITKDAAAHFDRAAERFVVEAKAAGSLNHPCINTIYDFGSILDVSYMVLEYLDGITLSQWMRSNPTPPSPRQIAPWVQQISSALDYAHSQKVIHRDLKPANLMVVHQGATVKLLDFGIAKLEDVGLTQTGMTVGTPSYMSPEQLTGSKVTPASDQYSLAVVLYQLFTYKLPYQGTKIPELCNRILKNELIPITDVNPTLGASFWEVLRKALSKAPEDRYPNCMALCQALETTYPTLAAAPA